MTPQPDQQVKLIFYNNTVIQGLVHSWTKEQAVIKTNNDHSFLIVNHPDRDIMLTVIIPESKNPQSQQQFIPPVMEEEIQETLEQPIPSNLKVKRLSELHLLKVQSEKEIVANKLKSHLAGGLKPVEYQMPGFLRKK